MSSFFKKFQKQRKLGLLTLGALGVVYGDIGTSPLYAINEIFFGHGKVEPSPTNVYGCISLVVWSLTIVVAIKYILFVLRADNDGEGGVFALFGLLKGEKKWGMGMLLVLLLFAAGLLFGDGLITPAISVLSAIEGLQVAAPTLHNFIVPLTVLILIGLFSIQRKGTARVGNIFGPIIILWFAAIALLGLNALLAHPGILSAFNPLYGIRFVAHSSLRLLFAVLGAVMLTVTGGEALYADMGHFGKAPIRLGWFMVVYPALILNYLGQGAYLLSGKIVAGENIFYSMVPSLVIPGLPGINLFIYPMVILATLATIIASQALISGGFSLAMQAVSLGLFPRLRILHTHEEHEGQIYLPFINWALFTGCVCLVVIFRSSTALASAYGLAVSGVMLITSLAMMAVARHLWRWSVWKTCLLFGAFAIVDASFLFANSLKFLEGGFIPFSIGIGIFAIMTTWRWGRARISSVFSGYPSMTVGELVEMRKSAKEYLPKSIVFMNPNTVNSLDDHTPPLLQVFWERNGMLPKHIILLTVVDQKVAYVEDERYHIEKFWEEEGNGSIAAVNVNFGFMEDHNVEGILEGLADQHEITIDENPKNWLIQIVQERILPGTDMSIPQRAKLGLFNLLLKNSDSADHYFGLGNEVGLSTEIIPVKIV